MFCGPQLTAAVNDANDQASAIRDLVVPHVLGFEFFGVALLVKRMTV